MTQVSMTQQAIPASRGWAPFALGFRPFFLLAGLAGVVLMLIWLGMWHSLPVDYYGQIGWHAHEMLFGFSVAILAGFLLTAVRNWTGIDTPSGRPLALLALVWLLGRLAPWVGLPGWAIALLDMAFLPALALALARPLWRGANRVNRVFLPLLLAMAVANGLVHLQGMGIALTAASGHDLMLNLILTLLILVAGRVLPFFARSVIPGFEPVTRVRTEQASFGLMGLIVLFELFSIEGLPFALLYAAFALVQALRLAAWYHPRIWSMPVLWVLYLGYLWLLIGSVLSAFAQLGWFMPSAALHAMTAGAVGVFTLGMMARVALGHTGRSIDVSMPTAYAFIALNLGVALRVFGPALVPEYYLLWILLSGLLWIMALVVFLAVYLPILLRPRVDGRPG